EILIKLSNLYSVSIDYLLGLSDFPDRIIKK
ncbi:XRE family transcriptional regulator, partial [Streptococcus agalactiae]